jgi:hypothetical protein
MSTQTSTKSPEQQPAQKASDSQYVLPARHGAPRLVPADAQSKRVPTCGELDLLC